MVNAFVALWVMGVFKRKFGGFCLALLLAFGAFATGHAAPGQTIELDQKTQSPISQSLNVQTQNVKTERPRAPLRLRNRGGTEIPSVGPGLQATAFASSLGDISAMALGADSEIYVLDQNAGRLFLLTDRDLDGRMDIKRVIATKFSQPSGLIYTEQGLYISDSTAIWYLDLDTFEKRMLASLENVTALSAPRPMILSPDKSQLIIALSDVDNTQIISVDRVTGKAAQIANGAGQVTAMAQTSGSPIWLGIKHNIVPVIKDRIAFEQGRALEPGATIESISLPTSGDMTAPALTYLAGQFLIVQGGDYQLGKNMSGGRNLVAVPSSFGTPQPRMKVLVDGFVSSHGRAAWGEPRHLAWDQRGLFLSDGQNGVIWKIDMADPVIIPTKTSPKEALKFYDDDTEKKPQAKWGSSIVNGSSLTVGSAIGKNWEEDKVIPNETLMEKIRREEAEEREANQ